MKKLLLLFSILISFNSYGDSSNKTFCFGTGDAVILSDSIYLLNDLTKPFSGTNLCNLKLMYASVRDNLKFKWI